MLSPVPGPITAPSRSRTTSVGPSTSGRHASQSFVSSTTSRRSGRQRPSVGDQYPVPEASPRSVVNRPLIRNVSQSCGSSTRARRSNVSGSHRWSHDSLLIVNDATGTEPHAFTHGSGPPSCSTSHAASGADSVSFQSLAGRITCAWSSSATSPCCWAAIAIATTAGVPAWRRASTSASRHFSGSCSLWGGDVSGWEARPNPMSSPVSASRISTFVDWVDESTPRTSATSLLGWPGLRDRDSEARLVRGVGAVPGGAGDSRVPRPFAGSANAEEQLGDELVEALVPPAAGGEGVDVDLLAAEPRHRLGRVAVGEDPLGEPVDLRFEQRFGDVGVGGEPRRLLLEDEVRPHAAACELPDAVDALGAVGVGVEV